jgi:MFS family permease
MTDIYGRRAGVIFASTFFAIGTLLCGIAKYDWVMIVSAMSCHMMNSLLLNSRKLGRVVGGAGGGCLNTVSTFGKINR